MFKFVPIPYIMNTKDPGSIQLLLPTLKSYMQFSFESKRHALLCFIKFVPLKWTQVNRRMKANISKTHTFVKCIILECAIYINSPTQQLTWNKV